MGTIRKIRFLELLGRGGFGAVYLVEVQGGAGFVQRVALKVMNPHVHDSPDMVARQRDEARLLGLLNHDNIVKVHDLVEWERKPCVLMEYVEGADAASLLRHTPFPLRATLEVGQQVASALHAGWTAIDPRTNTPLQVIHRDIKPANILISRHGGVKVLDFGIARGDFDREGQTESAQLGTSRYMAPEQWLFTQSSDRVDVLALGMSLMEMMVGRPLNRAPVDEESFNQHIRSAVAHVGRGPWSDAVRDEVQDLFWGMTRWNPIVRMDAQTVRERCLSLLDKVAGEGLTRYAPRCVPVQIAARVERFRDEPLPRATELPSESIAHTDRPARSRRPPQPVVIQSAPVAQALESATAPLPRVVTPTPSNTATAQSAAPTTPLGRDDLPTAEVQGAILARPTILEQTADLPAPAVHANKEEATRPVVRVHPKTDPVFEATTRKQTVALPSPQAPRSTPLWTKVGVGSVGLLVALAAFVWALPSETSEPPAEVPTSLPASAAAADLAQEDTVEELVEDPRPPSPDQVIPTVNAPARETRKPEVSPEVPVEAPAEPAGAPPEIMVQFSSSPPGATVWVDGSPLAGSTPVSAQRLSAGARTVRFVLGDSECTERSVRIGAASDVTLHCDLERGIVQLRH